MEQPVMKIDGRQSATALRVQRGACRLLISHGFATLTEFSLASGRRVDIIAVRHDGTIWIVEVKSSPNDFWVDQKWPEYRDFCDRFYFAIPVEMDQSIMPENAGLIVADGFGAEIIREPDSHIVHAARRKSITLNFARCAATRLHTLFDPQGQS